MSQYRLEVRVKPRPGLLDPQGKAVEHALDSLGFSGVEAVRQGKYIELELSECDPQKAEADVKQMCERLLANTVIENYDIEISA